MGQEQSEILYVNHTTGINNAVSKWVRLWGFDSEVSVRDYRITTPS